MNIQIILSELVLRVQDLEDTHTQKDTHKKHTNKVVLYSQMRRVNHIDYYCDHILITKVK